MTSTKLNSVVHFISIVFIFLFVYTATSKFQEFASFKTILSKSPLIGNKYNSVAWSLPLIELVVSSLLFFAKTRLTGLCLSAVLMSVFTIYIACMIVFSPHLPCSCGGVLKQMSWRQHLVFNSIFTALALGGVLLAKRAQNLEVSKRSIIGAETEYSI